MRAVYVAHDGASLHREGERLVVRARREKHDEIAVHGLDQVVLMGNVTVTPSAIDLLLDRNVDTVFVSHHGRYRGRIVGSWSGNVTLRIAQYRKLTTDGGSLELARAVVDGKLANQRTVLQRQARRHGESDVVRQAVRAIRFVRARLASATCLDAVRGCEGAGASAYFKGLSEVFRVPDMPFDGRNRRPPVDPVNALLSFGYTLLQNVVNAAAEAVGLDPYLGALHAPVAGRPSLVCDLVEEHRAPLIDSMVVAAVNKRAFTAADFRDAPEGEPVLMKRETIRWLVTLFERRLQRKVAYRGHGESVHRLRYRDVIEHQCRRVARYLLQAEPYEPYLIR